MVAHSGRGDRVLHLLRPVSRPASAVRLRQAFAELPRHQREDVLHHRMLLLFFGHYQSHTVQRHVSEVPWGVSGYLQRLQTSPSERKVLFVWFQLIDGTLQTDTIQLILERTLDRSLTQASCISTVRSSFSGFRQSDADRSRFQSNNLAKFSEPVVKQEATAFLELERTVELIIDLIIEINIDIIIELFIKIIMKSYLSE